MSSPVKLSDECCAAVKRTSGDESLVQDDSRLEDNPSQDGCSLRTFPGKCSLLPFQLSRKAAMGFTCVARYAGR